MSPLGAESRARLEALASPICLPAGNPPVDPASEDRVGARLADPSEVTLVAASSNRTRHHALDCLATPLTAPVDIPVECLAGPLFGRVSDCVAASSARPDLERAAVHLARTYNAMVDDAESDPDARFRVRFDIRLDPADRIEAVREPTEPLLQVSDVRWLTSPRMIPWERYYPDRALRHELEADLALICLIRSDQSLLCTEAALEPAGRELFLMTASVLESRAKAMADLVDGSTSTGRWVAIHLRFRIPN